MSSLSQPAKLLAVPAVSSASRDALHGWVRRMITAIRNRRTVAQLADADAATLRDIGVSGADVATALSKPLWTDPSIALARSAGRRIR